MKDFLFLYFSFVPGPEYFFRSIENSGYTCDFVTENTIEHYTPSCEYRVVICYLHDSAYLLHVNRILSHPLLTKTFMVQHDDTDFTNVMSYYERKPQLVFQRELTHETVSAFQGTAIPMHFAFPSIYDESLQTKDIDVSFVGMQTNPKRKTFVDHIVSLAKGDLQHLTWVIDNSHHRNHDEFVRVANRSKICLHFPGNSQDSIRIWELASAKTCLLMPPTTLLSLSELYMPLHNYVKFSSDLHDLKDVILYQLSADRYKYAAQNLFDEYNQNHTPLKCFEQYYAHLLRFAPIESKLCNPLPSYNIYKKFWDAEEHFWKDKR